MQACEREMTKEKEKDSSNLTNPESIKKDSVCESSGPIETPTEIEVNRNKEPLFKRYVGHEINELSAVPEQDLIYSGAEKLGLSPVTTARYLKKMVSKEGLYQRKLVGSVFWIMYKNEI